MRCIRGILTALILALFVSCAALGQSIVRDGQPLGCIVVPEGTEKGSVLTAAKALSGYLREMSGAQVPIRWDSDNCPGFRILIGSTRFAPVAASEVSDKRVGFDGFIIRSVRNGVVIAGRTPAGTANGIYHFAESVLGVHWFTIEDAGPTIPKRRTVRVPNLKLVSKPSFEVRGEYYTINLNYLPEEQKSRIDGWGAFNRLGGIEAEHYHSFYVFVPDSLFDQHPEYFPLIDGKRIPGHEHVQRCLSNPDVPQMAIDYSAKWFDEHPETKYTSLSENDGYGWCQCEGCKAMGPTPSHQMLAFANNVAAALESRFPDRGFLFYAYMATIDPPVGMKAHRNVRTVIAPIHECNVHPIASNCPDKVKLRRVYDGWSRIAGDFGWYPYLNGGVFTTPSAMMIADEMRYVRSRGCFISFREHTCAPGVGWPMIAWMEASLIWDVNQEAGKLRRQFIEGYYGKAAADSLEKVYDKIETGLSNSPMTPQDPSESISTHRFWPFDKLQPCIAPAIPDIRTAMRLADFEPEPFRSRILKDTKALLGEIEIVPK